MHGRSKPRIQQKQRIEKALHSFANELADVSVLCRLISLLLFDTIALR